MSGMTDLEEDIEDLGDKLNQLTDRVEAIEKAIARQEPPDKIVSARKTGHAYVDGLIALSNTHWKEMTESLRSYLMTIERRLMGLEKSEKDVQEPR